MCGLFGLSVVVGITNTVHGTFFAHQFSFRVCVFNGWPETTLLLPVWPRDAKMLDTPNLGYLSGGLGRILIEYSSAIISLQLLLMSAIPSLVWFCCFSGPGAETQRTLRCHP